MLVLVAGSGGSVPLRAGVSWSGSDATDLPEAC